jgi:plastocyanin
VVLSIEHALAESSEAVTLNATSPTGVTVGFTPSSPVQVPASTGLNVTLTLTASATAPIGNQTITIHGTAGSNSQTSSFTLRVVEYRVVMVHSTFSPSVLNVTAGTTVYWQNLDGPAAGCGGGQSTGSGAHNVVFTTIQGANSPTINQFGTYSYTFSTPGSYFYYSSIDTDHLMNGTINVLSSGGGGGGMSINMPVFSYFKDGSTPSAPVAAGATMAAAAAKPAGGDAAPLSTAARGLGLADLFFPNEHSSVFSGLGMAAAIGALLSIAALGAALAASAAGRSKVSPVGAGLISRPLPSESAR